MTDPISTRLARWKQKLIDPTLRNPLLNFRPTRLTTIRVVDEKPTEVFRILQLDGKEMTFRPASEQTIRSGSEEPNEFIPQERSALDARHTDRELQTDLIGEVLDVTLLRIFQKATSAFEEQGVSSLCLSLGMLEWLEETNSETRLRAPLVLIPVQLQRQTARSKFTLNATQDDPVLNPAIVEKLRNSYRIALPQLPDSYEDFDAVEYFRDIHERISEQEKWRITEEINLAFFAFQKFVMYKDLEVAEEVYAAHEVIQVLCAGKTDDLYDSEDADIDNLDDVLKPESHKRLQI